MENPLISVIIPCFNHGKYLDNEYMHFWADRKLPRMAQNLQILYQSFVNRIFKRTNE